MTDAQPPRSRSSDSIFLVSGAALLVAAMFLEQSIADMHGVPVSRLDEHSDVPATMHLFAIGSLILTAVPALRSIVTVARKRRLHWQAVPLFLLATTVAVGRPIVAAVLGLVLAVGTSVWRRIEASGRLRQSD